MIDMADYRMPSVEEVLAGETQAGVPRPKFADEDIWHTPSTLFAPPSPLLTRWQAVKALLRIIFKGSAA